jgi:hypothetical protein
MYLNATSMVVSRVACLIIGLATKKIGATNEISGINQLGNTLVPDQFEMILINNYSSMVHHGLLPAICPMALESILQIDVHDGIQR